MKETQIWFWNRFDFKKRIYVVTVLVAGLKRRQRELREWPPLLMRKRGGSIFFTLNYLVVDLWIIFFTLNYLFYSELSFLLQIIFFYLWIILLIPDSERLRTILFCSELFLTWNIEIFNSYSQAWTGACAERGSTTNIFWVTTKYQELIWRISHTVNHLITCDNKSFYESHVSLSVGVGFVVGYSNICMCLADILVFLFISRNLLISVNLSKYIFGSSFLLEKIPISLRSPFWQI